MANELTFTVAARPYAGKNPALLTRHAGDSAAAPVLEKYLLDNVRPGRPHTEAYSLIAKHTGVDLGTVRSVLSRERGEENGITW